MPDRVGVHRYDGEERRQHNRRAEDRQPLKHGPYTAWQWAILFLFTVFVLALVPGVAIYSLSKRADENARRGNAAICAQVAYLNAQTRTLEGTVRQNPRAPETPARRHGADELRKLVAQLQQEIPDCREALR